MKIWNIGALCVLATVVAAFRTETSDAGYIEELFLDNCATLANVQKGSIKNIITMAGIVNSCPKEITDALDSSNGAIIIMGADKSANALACSKLNTHSELYFNKYYDLPPSVKTLNNYIYNSVELDIKVYTTSQDKITENLKSLILDARYDEAVSFSTYLYNSHPDSGKNIIYNAVRTILYDNAGYQIMNYAFKLSQNNKIIIEKCFPAVFKQIFNGEKSRILNKEKNGALRLSSSLDEAKDRSLYIDCTNDEVPNDTNWQFIPTWDYTLDSVIFHIQNTKYGMKLKLDYRTTGLYTMQRMAWGDEKSTNKYGKYAWRLFPVGFNTEGEVLFCFNDVFYDYRLVHMTCSSSKEDVVGIKRSCSSEIGLIIETNDN